MPNLRECKYSRRCSLLSNLRNCDIKTTFNSKVLQNWEAEFEENKNRENEIVKGFRDIPDEIELEGLPFY